MEIHGIKENTLKNFYLFRHGQTEMNFQKRWQGAGFDEPLNDVGEQQARELLLKLREARLDVIYTSPLKRAVQTAEIIADGKIEVVQDVKLKEASFGYAEGLTLPEVYEKFPDIAGLWQSLSEDGMDVAFPPDGETKRQIQKRIVTCLEKIALKEKRKNIGISIHSALLRCFLLNFGIKKKEIPHGVPVHFVYDENGWTMKQDLFLEK